VSRGIGTNQSIRFNPGLHRLGERHQYPPRDPDYYKWRSTWAGIWKLRLVPTNGEAMMLIQKDYLPNVVGAGSSPVQIAGGRVVQRFDTELFTQLRARPSHAHQRYLLHCRRR